MSNACATFLYVVVINRGDSFESFLFVFFLFLFQSPFKRCNFSYIVTAWESSDSFDSLSFKRHSISRVRRDVKPLQPGLRSPQPSSSHLSSDWVNSVSRCDVSADVSMLAFPDPANFTGKV